jgi:hypothetical protein
VVRAHELLAGELVEALGEALREATAVGEDDRAAVGTDRVEDPGVDRRPDRRPGLRRDRRAARLVLGRQDLPEPGHVLDRDDDLQVKRLAGAGVDDLDLSIRSDAAEERRDPLERALRGAEADALRRLRGFVVLRRPPAEVLEAFQGQGQVRAALGPGDGVDLVDDDVLDTREDLPGLARQQEVQAFRRGDQDVGRVAGQVATSVGGGIAGADPDRDVGCGLAEALRGERDAGERRAEVALHVVRERLERRHVQDADAAAVLARGLRAGLGDEAVEGPEERGERLAAAGGRMDERVPAVRDRVPAAVLRLRRLLERAPEPLAHGRAEAVERILGRGRTRGPGRRDHRTVQYRS